MIEELFENINDNLKKIREIINGSEEWKDFINTIGRENFRATLFFVRKNPFKDDTRKKEFEKYKKSFSSLRRLKTNPVRITESIWAIKIPKPVIEYLEYDKKVPRRAAILYSVLVIKELKQDIKVPTEMYEIIALMNIIQDVVINRDDYFFIKVVDGKLIDFLRFYDNLYFRKPRNVCLSLNYYELIFLKKLYNKYKKMDKKKINGALQFILSIKEQYIIQFRVVLLSSAMEYFIGTPDKGVKKYFIERYKEISELIKSKIEDSELVGKDTVKNITEESIKKFYESIRSAVVHGDIYLKQNRDITILKMSEEYEKFERFYEVVLQAYILYPEIFEEILNKKNI